LTQHSHSSFWHLNYAGGLILLALLLGGASRQGIWTDGLLQVLMIPAVVIGFTRLFDNHLGNAGKLLVILSVASMLLQFLPVDIDRGFPTLSGEAPSSSFWSISPGRSLNAAVFGFSVLGYCLYLLTFSQNSLRMLVRFLFLGLAINVLITVIQLSYDRNITIEGLLPYTIRMGMFDNENHFGSLIYLSLPLLAWRFIWAKSQILIYVAAGIVLVGLQYAVGSRSGMAMSSVLFVLCFLWAHSVDINVKARTVLIGSGAVIALAGFWFTASSGILIVDDLRAIYLPQTWRIAWENWLTGSGLGSFILVYPFYETSETLGRVYANHAHSDHLELFLELGIWYFGLLVFYIVLIARSAIGTPLQQAAAISITALLLHSVVDYPLRTMGIAVCFALLTAIALNDSPEKLHRHKQQHRHSA